MTIGLRFRLPREDAAIVREALQKAATKCDYSKNSLGLLLEMMCIDVLNGTPILPAARSEGKRESLALRVHPMRLPMIDLAIREAREAGADDSTAIYWISRSDLGMTDPPGQTDAPVGAARHQGAAGEDHASGHQTPGTLAGEPQGNPHPSGGPSDYQGCHHRRPDHPDSTAPAQGQHLETAEHHEPTAGSGSVHFDGGGEAYPAEPAPGSVTFGAIECDYGIPGWWLRDFALHVDSMYVSGWVPKKDGSGWREIHAPDVVLKGLQRFLLDHLIAPAIHSPIAFGHTRQRDHLAACRCHAFRRPRWLVTCDIEKFHPSITAEMVTMVFRYRLGCAQNLAATLAKLCTREGVLPQGAPTSPAIASLLLTDLDRMIYDIAKSLGCWITRFADDFGVSGDDRQAVETVLNVIAEQIASIDLRTNSDKSKPLMGSHEPMVYLGLNLAHGRLSVPKAFRNALDHEVYKAFKFGIRAKALARLRGQVRYVERFHQTEGRRLVAQLKRAQVLGD